VATNTPPTTLAPAVVTVDPRGASRVASGHPWVYANEIREPMKTFTPGGPVTIMDPRGRLLGHGFVNPKSLIAARVLSRDTATFDAAFFAERLRTADAYRRRFRPGASSFRLCFGESDNLPGLVIDRFDDVFVVQSHAAGIDALLEPIVAGLVSAFSPRGILLKCDSTSRTLEGVPNRMEVAFGDVPERLEVTMEGSKFALDLRKGQKTGFFHDQAENREWLGRQCAGARVLDMFSYVGAWSLAAARGGAKEVLGVDSSADAVAWATENARLSGVADRVRFEKGDAFERLETLQKTGERFDVVVLDPPAFVKSKKKIEEGLKGYREVNRRGFALVRPGGILATSTCSRHVDRNMFLGMLHAAADDSSRPARIIAYGRQGADHPVLLRMPETEYLTTIFFEVG
jgi:23S rRNA (cytosine1962-C5)-methyltransferase